MSEKLILVTGANGFVGSHLVEALLARGDQVHGLVRRNSDLAFVAHLPVEWVYGDLQDTESLSRACAGVDAICHCAALTRALDPETFQRVNAQGTLALAQAALEANPDLDRFLFVSSQAAAGPSRSASDFVDEACPPQPLDWYGQSKWAAEQGLLDLADRLPLTIVRPSPVFGPRDRDFFAYFALVRRGLSLKLGRKERRVSLIYIHDLVKLLLLALDSGPALGQTYFGCGPAHTYTELTAAIAQALDKRTVPITLPVALLMPLALGARVQERFSGKPALLNEQRILNLRQPYWLCSGEKARRELGFAPDYDLKAAVQETADWYLTDKWL